MKLFIEKSVTNVEVQNIEMIFQWAIVHAKASGTRVHFMQTIQKLARYDTKRDLNFVMGIINLRLRENSSY